MFKEFWETKKHLIQFVGILTGVGALFLSITLPENVQARQALINIQFVWLIIITICLIVLFREFIRLADTLEKKFKTKNNIDFTDTFSLLVSLTLIYLIFNLWDYMINLYKKSFLDYMKTSLVALTSFIGAIIFHFWRKILLKIPEKPVYKRISFSLFAHAILSIICGLLIELVFIGDRFNFLNALSLAGIIYVIILIFFFWDKLRKL